jgi:putative phage-type endonuclease
VNEQQSEEWFQERLGHATASRASDILAKIKTGEAAVRRKYRIQLCTERLTKKQVPSFQNAAMLWGTEQEPYARMAYAAKTGADVEQVGFIKHQKMAWCGASPDGLIGVDGMVEIKCPESTTHLEWMEQGRVPPEHVGQIQYQLWVTGRSWNDFVSFDPRFPEHLQLLVVRAPRDEKFIADLAAEVGAFLLEVDALYTKLMGGKQ